MKINNTIIFFLLMAFMGSFMISCNYDKVEEEKERKIRLVYTDWSESIALTYLSKYLLEEKVNYEVVMKLTDVQTAYEDIADNKADVFTDAWLPETQKRYYNEHAEKIEKLGIIYPEARTGFVVPQYSQLQTIRDLSKYNYAIIGIDSGAGVMHKAAQALQKYKLDNELRDLSEEIMVKQLKDSVERRKEIVVTGWEPHWIFARYDVRFLDDPDNIFGESERIYALCRKDLNEVHPNAVRFFERMQLSEKQLNSLVYEVKMSEDPIQGVKKWIKHNETITNQWVKDLHKERLKIM